jgi:hypothetical protein
MVPGTASCEGISSIAARLQLVCVPLLPVDVSWSVCVRVHVCVHMRVCACFACPHVEVWCAPLASGHKLVCVRACTCVCASVVNLRLQSEMAP